MELRNAILANNKNLRKIENVVHPLVRKEMNLFLLPFRIGNFFMWTALGIMAVNIYKLIT